MSIATVSLAANNALITTAKATNHVILSARTVLLGITAQYDALTPTETNVPQANILALTVAINAQINALADSIAYGTPAEVVNIKSPAM
jgi:hypothetical protein